MPSTLQAGSLEVEDRTTSTFVREQPEEISLRDLITTLAREKRPILWTVLAAAFVSTTIALLLPVEYRSEAVILTPQQAQPSLTAMAQAAGLGQGMGLPGLSLLTGFGLRNPSDLYVGILQSRTIADALIGRFHLKDVYGDKYLEQARKHLSRRTSIKAGKDTLIHIQVEDHDAKRAAQLANAYVEELSLRNTTVALTEASARRLFFEQQLAKEKDLLATAEDALRDTQQFTGLVEPGGQAAALIRSASQLHAEILSREAELAGMRVYVADDNPRFQMVSRQLSTLRSELATMERGEHVAGAPEVPVGKLPEAALQYLRKYREVKYHETLFEALAKQFEAARLDEAKAAPVIQTIDAAVVAERKSWPPRTVIVLTSVLLAGVLSACWILFVSGKQLNRGSL
jgi:uncharacterized protein involved in exopolysaccharide biosynthesis